MGETYRSPEQGFKRLPVRATQGMPIQAKSELVEFDADAALEAALKTVDGPIYSFVEFSVEDFHTLFVADETLAMYESREHMEEHFGRIHDYVHLDFTEIDLFTKDLLPEADEAHYIATAFDFITLVRIYQGNEGVFVAVDSDEPVGPLVDAVRSATEPSDAGAQA